MLRARRPSKGPDGAREGASVSESGVKPGLLGHEAETQQELRRDWDRGVRPLRWKKVDPKWKEADIINTVKPHAGLPGTWVRLTDQQTLPISMVCRIILTLLCKPSIPHISREREGYWTKRAWAMVPKTDHYLRGLLFILLHYKLNLGFLPSAIQTVEMPEKNQTSFRQNK